MFDSIAHSYDGLNHILSFGLDDKWRKEITIKLPTTRHIKVLDVATGTGDLAIMIAQQCHAKINAIDVSEKMLEKGREKALAEKIDEKIVFQNANVENLPFDDNTFDYCTISFGVRNFSNLNKSLKEIYRCLKPGGKLFIIEFGKKPSNKMFRVIYNIYSKIWIPLVGGVLSRNFKAYRYLPNSINKFIHYSVFMKKMESIGFSSVCKKKLTNGIVIFYEGVKIKEHV